MAYRYGNASVALKLSPVQFHANDGGNLYRDGSVVWKGLPKRNERFLQRLAEQ
jgi:hypothetical protein